jgi:hypothetical protein
MSGITDLEVWLSGDPASVAATVRILRERGRITYSSDPQPLGGADTGRVRRYLRLAPTAPTSRRTVNAADAEDLLHASQPVPAR